MRNCPAWQVLLVAAAMAPLSAAPEAATGLKEGNRVPPFPVSAITGPHAGKTLVYVSALQGAPTLIVFVKTLDAPAVELLQKADELSRKHAAAGLKSFCVCLAGQSAAPQLRELAAKHKWVIPLTVTRGGASDPAVKLCKLSPKAQNTVIVSVKHLVAYAKQDLTPKSFGVVAETIQKAVAKK